MSQTEKVALVTGAAARIGAATCDALHKAGYFVIVHYRSSREPAAALVKRLNENRTNSSVLIQADLCDMQAVEKLAKETLEVKGRVDVLINNASSFYPTPMGAATQEHWDDLFGSNARAPFFLSQALAPELAKQKGCIVNLVDIYAERPKPKHPVYVMAKAANAMMVKTLALELAPDIRVNGVAPGAALWPTGTEHTTDKQEILKRIPMGRPAGAEQIVNAIMFMVDGNDYVTGQILAVDGGRSVQQ